MSLVNELVGKYRVTG